MEENDSFKRRFNKKNKGRKDHKNDFSEKFSQNRNENRDSLDIQSIQYYQRILNMINKDFDTAEEKEIFIQNISSELKENVVKVAKNKIGGSLLEKVVLYVDINTFCDLFEGLSEDWDSICSSKSASFVVQAFVKQSRNHLLDKAINTSALPAETLKTQQTRLLTLLIENLGTFLCSNLGFNMQHNSVSHVIRGLLELLCTKQINERVVFGRKNSTFKQDVQKKKMEDLYKKDVKKKYKKKMHDYLISFASLVAKLPKLQDHAMNTFSGPVLQALLEALSEVGGEEASDVIDGLIKSMKLLPEDEEEEEEDESQSLDSKLGLLLDASGSHMFEPVLKHSSDAVFHSIFHRFFSGNAAYLASHPIGYFVLQSCIESLRTPQQLEQVYKELQPHFESLLALNHTPLLIKLAAASTKLLSCQQIFVEDLVKCFHCDHDNKELFRLLLFLVTYERLHEEEEEQNDENEEDSPEEKSKELKVEAKEEEKEMRKNINKHGSMLIQELLKMSENQLILSSMRGLGVEEMMAVAVDPCGCRVIEVLMRSGTVPEEHKEWCLKSFKGKYVDLACDKFGSRTFDSVWEYASDKKKNTIKNELRPHIEKIRSDKFGRFVFLKCGFNERKRKNESNSNKNFKNKKKK